MVLLKSRNSRCKEFYKLDNTLVAQIKINNNYSINANMLLNFLILKQTKVTSTAISYKNRFLSNKATFSNRLACMYVLDGKKLTSLKLVYSYYTNFLRAYQGLTVDPIVRSDLNLDAFNLNEFDFLYKTYDLFKDMNRSFLWRINSTLPVIKPISKLIKQKKQKKRLKLRKYSVEYIYVLPERRVAVSIRWLSLITKIKAIKVSNSLHKGLTPFLINPENSDFNKFKVKIYSGLLEQV